jgi:hypothetical protein
MKYRYRGAIVRGVFFTLAVAAALSANGCAVATSNSSSSSSTDISSSSSITKVSFGDSTSTATVTLTGLSAQSVYLVKVNNSATEVPSSKTGYANLLSSGTSKDVASDDGASDVAASSNAVSGKFGSVTRHDFGGARTFDANPPAIPASAARSTAATGSKLYSTSDVNSTSKTFNVVTDENASAYTWTTVSATLRAISDYANVWVASDYYDSSATSSSDGKITSDQAQKIADTFAKIYPVETNVLGHEYGYSDGSGGRDGDLRVNILVYDIGFDTADDPVTNGGIVGYFWGKDYYTTDYLTSLGYSYKSNYSEIFYVDSLFADEEPGIMYSTLVHEFQHMINWNGKYVTNGKSSDSWYDEMLSMSAEDMMSSHLETWLGDEYDALSDGPITIRMAYFDNGFYATGVTDWFTSSSLVYYSYGSAYAFGAYLTRNYGGAAMLQALEANSSTGVDSVSAALASLGCSETTFSAAFQRYCEALVYSSSAYSDDTVPSSINTFDRAVTDTVGDYGYTFPAFDIWYLSYTYKGTTTVYSPSYYSAAERITLRPYGMSLHSASAWQSVTGSLSITLYKPTDSNVSLYLMVR